MGVEIAMMASRASAAVVMVKRKDVHNFVKVLCDSDTAFCGNLAGSELMSKLE